LNIQRYFDEIVHFFHSELGDQLAGVYVHGSYAMGCFHPDKSDIDFLVVVKEKLAAANMRRITNFALWLHDRMPVQRGIEFSVILENYLNNFKYPTPFEYHYSEFHRERYRMDEFYICGGFTDEDLAAQITVAYHRGITLYGKPLAEMYPPIDEKYYLASIVSDVEGAARNIFTKPSVYLTPTYITLNLCRVLYFLREGAVASKREGGEWGLTVLPSKFHRVISASLDEYNGEIEQNLIEMSALKEFVDYMLGEIKRIQKRVIL